MLLRYSTAHLTVVSLLALLVPVCSYATEGTMGRPITAQQITSNAGIVPPKPGWAFSVSSIYFDGDLGGSRQVPIAGEVSAGIKTKASYTIGNLTRIWDTGTGEWNFASAIGVPLQYVKASTSIQAGAISSDRSDSTTGIADILITPIIAGFHFSKTDHISLSLPIYAPSASYDSQDLANDGQNTWTFMPTIAYTHLGQNGSEFTAMGMVQFYTRNDDTDYRNAPLLVSELLWTGRVAKDTNLGVVGGVIYQLGDDKGPTADRLNGFKGHAVGLGPILTWSGKIGNAPGSLSARAVWDVDTKNRPKGYSIGVSMSLLF
jgi:hypothetical protein